ncbi:MAG: S41 family peptidase [Flavobacteriales bacterium]
MKNILSTLLLITVTTVIYSQQLDERATTEKFNKALYYINNLYVDSVDANELVEIALTKMLEELDPHTSYIPAEEVKKASEPLKGNFEGIGVQFNVLKDTIFIVQTISGGPSEKIGLMANDKIITIDGENVAGIGIQNSDVIAKLKGTKGTKVTVGIKRGKSRDIVPYTITRDKIPIYSVDASYMIDSKTGYIKVNRFSATTQEEMTEALLELKSDGMKDLVLDLQGNGGGYLNTAIWMADEFLSDDKLIVYTEGRAYPRDNRYAKSKGLFEKGRLVVLIDESSASASEIVSGAIQDWDRGMIVGRRSFGKGLVQRPIQLPDGSEMRLTMQKYYTPAGRCIQKSYEGGVEEYRKEKWARYDSGEVYSLDSLDLPDSLKYYTSTKRVVYGGGGILPDLFVPLDTTGVSEYFSKLVRSGTVNTYVLNYIDANRPTLMDEYEDISKFKKKFDLDKTIMDGLIEAGEKEDIEFNEDDFQTSKNVLEIRLKALIARNLYGSNAFYEIINDLNEALQSGIKALENGQYEGINLAFKDFK